MSLDLTKPEKEIVIFDLETTGLDKQKDRIVQIALVRLDRNLQIVDHYEAKVNPEMPITEQASEVHGITDDDVKDKPIFKDIHQEVLDRFKGADIGGYNNISFDIPFLANEFIRCGRLLWPSPTTLIFDSKAILAAAFPRTLKAAVKIYLNEEFDEEAHDALADATKTAEVFREQLSEHNDEFNVKTWQQFADVCRHGNRYIDAGRLFYVQQETIYFGFGKHQDEEVRKNPNYVRWMMGAEFSINDKILLALVMEQEYFNFRMGRLSRAQIVEVANKHIRLNINWEELEF